MKRWAALTVLLYLTALIVLSAPVIALAFANWSGREGTSVKDTESFEVYREYFYWVWLAIMGTSQALLLLLPINLAERKLTPRRPLLVPVFTATILLANLCAAGLISALCAIFKDQGLNIIEWMGNLMRGNFEWNPLAKQALQAAGTTPNNEWLVFISGALAIIVGFWAIWALVFFRFSKSDQPDALLQRIVRWLLHGSILELLVAVPSHIIVRRRGDCCAPMGTFWGITMGISVMLLCFGPGVFFLFAKRFQRLRSKEPNPLH